MPKISEKPCTPASGTVSARPFPALRNHFRSCRAAANYLRTPHWALRRVGDHLVDHLAEIECRLAGLPGLTDQWHGRMVTLDCEFARFTEVDLDEATSRLTRLAACYEARLAGLEATQLDARPADDVWTIREVAHHVGGVRYYAKAVGRPGGGMRQRPAAQAAWSCTS
jgi:hypothetical protein